MPSYSESQIALIDSRIDQATVKAQKMGTVQDREFGTARAIVVFDGSAGTGQSVKCFETVTVDVGDRVGLVKFEGEWIIVGSYTPRHMADVLLGVDMSSTNSTAVATYTDVPTSPRVNFVKTRDVTQLQLFIAISMYCGTSPTVAGVGVNITLPDGSNFDQELYHRAINAANDHREMVGGITTPGLTLPGGGYSVVARWRRISGGTLFMDANDSCTLHVKEVVD
jgi:hypothetical protein